MSHGTVLIDPTDGLWKAWYTAGPEASLHRVGGAATGLRRVDRRGELGEAQTGYLLLPGPTADQHPDRPQVGRSGPQRFRDRPSDAPPDRRYEMFILRLPGWYCPYRVVRALQCPLARTPTRRGGRLQSRPLSIPVRRRQALGTVGIGRVRHRRRRLGFATGGRFLCRLPQERHSRPSRGLSPYDVAVGVCRVIMRRTGRTGFRLVRVRTGADAGLAGFQRHPVHGAVPAGAAGWIRRTGHRLSHLEPDGGTSSSPPPGTGSPGGAPTGGLRAAGGPGRLRWRDDLADASRCTMEEGSISTTAVARVCTTDYMSTEPAERMRQAELPEWPHYWQPSPWARTPAVRLPASSVHRRHRPSLLGGGTAVGRGHRRRRFTTGDLLTRAAVPHQRRVVVNAVTVGEGKLEAELVSGVSPSPGSAAPTATDPRRPPRGRDPVERGRSLSRGRRTTALLHPSGSALRIDFQE